MTTRNTEQQKLVEQVFLSLNHPSAQDVVKKVHELYPTIGRATVYRVLKRLCDKGEVLQINREESCVYYDKNNFAHPHSYCIKCGKIRDICFDKTFDKCAKELSNAISGFDTLGIDFKIIGVCPDCKK